MTSPTAAGIVAVATSETSFVNVEKTSVTAAARLASSQMLQVKVQSSGESKSVKNTLHHALGPFLLLSRCFGILPVMGVNPSADVAKVYFKWSTLPVLVAIVMTTFAFLDFCLSFKVLVEQGLKLTTTAPLSFSVECLSAYIVFLFLSRNWPNLIKSTRRLENTFLQQIYSSKDSRKFSRRIRYIGWSFIFTAVVEHLFYIASGIYSNHLQIKRCNLTVNFWHNYYVRERLQIFSLVDYTPWLIPFIQWLTISMTFTWNFIDIFLILISQGLATRFCQFNWCIKNHIKENMPTEFWLKMREDFIALSELLWEYDDKLSILILLSSAQNLYFLAVQIFHTFHISRENFMMDLYFWTSLTFVVIRTSFMMLSASKIHDTANDLIATIYEIPTSQWCLELKRLNEVIVSDLYALSGKGFFFLTKRLMFAMAGTLVIYELVLLDQVDGNDVKTPLCNQRKS